MNVFAVWNQVMLLQQWGYGLLKYSFLECYRYFCKSCIYDPVNTLPFKILMPNSHLTVETPTRCGVWGSEMTREKGALKQSLLFPPCWPGESWLLQEQPLPGVQSRGPTAPEQLRGAGRERSERGARPRHLWLHRAFVLPGGEGAQRFGTWALLWAFLRAGPVSFSYDPRALGRLWRSYVGRALGEGSFLWGILWGFMSYGKI